MSAHPEMVSGESRNDFVLMRAGRGDWVTKVGAEGVQAIGVRSKGWGIAVKVADGNARGLHPTTVAVLEQLGLLDDAQRGELSAWREPAIATSGHRQESGPLLRWSNAVDRASCWFPRGTELPAARTV
jgi:L-asparaginase II